MNSFLYKTHQLISGQMAPYSGGYVPAQRSRKASLDVRVTGSNGVNPTIKLFTENSFDGADIEFFSKTTNGDGYYHYEVTGLPVNSMKAGTQGVSGNFWVAVNQQN